MNTHKPSSLSQVSLLPMSAQAEHGRPTVMRIPLPIFLHKSTGEYVALNVEDAHDDDLSSDDEDLPKAKRAQSFAELSVADATVDPEALSGPPPPQGSVFRKIADAVWYIRMWLLMTIFCVATTFVASIAVCFIGNFFGPWWFSPFHEMDLDKEIIGSTVGAGVLGSAVAFAAFLRLVVRRARMTTAQRLEAGRDVSGNKKSGDEEPTELWTAVLAAGAASAFAMVVGMAVVPGLVTETFGLKHAATIGVWAFVVPLIPALCGGFISTLWRCNFSEGWNACC